MERERNISEFEESVLRACHHQFEALSQAEAAEKLGVSDATICRTLQEIGPKVPTMFPILTSRQYQVYVAVADRGLSLRGTADELRISEDSVKSFLARIRAKGVIIPSPTRMPDQYTESMDSSIRHKF